jgi:hypothetical protein
MGLRVDRLTRTASLRSAAGHDRTAMTPEAFDNVIRFSDSPSGQTCAHVAGHAIVPDHVRARESHR